MHCEVRSTGDTSVISLSGRFVFHSHRSFREAYEQALARSDTRVIQLDLGKVEYLDSSALGMLLLLKEKAEAVGNTVQLREVKGVVRQVLEIANFQKIFQITS
ncbi:MAG: STAS domain-containing protein [Pseudomonadota bacterium]|nr:STAS domain-containing protein [Pseudomonadota bacterium]MDP2352644.1 STAS domain-containing protein [Pseudomonadota bacterium]